jgi:hypothetical protein
MTTSPSAPITTITQLRDTAQHILDHWPPPPAVRRLVVLDHAILRKPTSATLEILAEATAAEAALALEVGLRVGWACCARSADPASTEVDAWAAAALDRTAST